MRRLFGRDRSAGTITPRSAAGGLDGPLATTPRHRAGAGRSTVGTRRRTSFARLVGAAGMLVLTISLFWLLTDDAFRVSQAGVSVVGARHADPDAVLAQLEGIDRAPNVFRIRASELVGQLSELPAIESAAAVVTLPASVSVRIEERRPVFAWSDGQEAWLVDEDGVLFAAVEGGIVALGGASVPSGDEEGSGLADDPGALETTEEAVLESDDPSTADIGAPDDDTSAVVLPEPDDEPAVGPSGSLTDAAAELPVVEDQRLLARPLSIGTALPPIDLAVMRQLLAVTPDLLGSASERLELSIDQLDGYVLRSDLGWQAVFGHYTPSLQPPEIVPRQVQCLTWLLASRERRLLRVRLAVSETSCGTFTRTRGGG